MRNPQLTLSDIYYRLFRNRRVLIVSTLLATTALALSVFIGGPDTFFGSLRIAGIVLLGWAILMAVLLVRFPNCWMEPLAFSLALVPFVSATPLYEFLLTMASPDQRIWGAIWLTFLVSFAWFFLSLGIVHVGSILLPRIKLGELREQSRVFYPLPAKTVFDALVPTPDRDDAMRSTGPVEKDGFFQSDIKAQMPNIKTFEVGDWSSGARMKILNRDSLSQTTLCVLKQADGNITTSVQVESCRDATGGSFFECDEVHDHHDVMCAIGGWFLDFAADNARARLDQMQGNRPRANRMSHYDTILTALARSIVARDAENQPPF